MRKIYYTIVLMIILNFRICSCDEENEPESISIIGSWAKLVPNDNNIDTLKITFRSKGIVEYYNSKNNYTIPVLEGYYQIISKGEIAFRDKKCTIDDSDNSIIGSYRIVLESKKLEFFLIKDECDRKYNLIGTAFRIK